MSYLHAIIMLVMKINFDYANSYSDKTNRSIETVKLIYKGQAWYL